MDVPVKAYARASIKPSREQSSFQQTANTHRTSTVPSVVLGELPEDKPRPLSADIVTKKYGQCPKCWYYHEGRYQVVRDPDSHTEIKCDRCQYKIFGLGGSPRRSSISKHDQPRRFTVDTIPEHGRTRCHDAEADEGLQQARSGRAETDTLGASNVIDEQESTPLVGASKCVAAEQKTDSSFAIAKLAPATPGFGTTVAAETRNFENRKRHKFVKTLYAFHGYEIRLQRREAPDLVTAAPRSPISRIKCAISRLLGQPRYPSNVKLERESKFGSNSGETAKEVKHADTGQASASKTTTGDLGKQPAVDQKGGTIGRDMENNDSEDGPLGGIRRDILDSSRNVYCACSADCPCRVIRDEVGRLQRQVELSEAGSGRDLTFLDMETIASSSDARFVSSRPTSATTSRSNALRGVGSMFIHPSRSRVDSLRSFGSENRWLPQRLNPNAELLPWLPLNFHRGAERPASQALAGLSNTSILDNDAIPTPGLTDGRSMASASQLSLDDESGEPLRR